MIHLVRLVAIARPEPRHPRPLFSCELSAKASRFSACTVAPGEAERETHTMLLTNEDQLNKGIQ